MRIKYNCYLTTYCYTRIGLTNQRVNNFVNSKSTMTYNSGTYTIELDISDLSGEYYIFCSNEMWADKSSATSYTLLYDIVFEI